MGVVFKEGEYQKYHSKEVGEHQKVSFLRSQIKLYLFSKCVSKHSVKTRW